MLTVHVALSAETVTHPDQLETTDPASGAAVSVTVLPVGAVPLHVPAFAVHARSGSVSSVDTVPRPVPAVRAVIGYAVGVNVAVTLRAIVIATVHSALSAETAPHPDHADTNEPGSGIARSVTVAPFGAEPVHIQKPVPVPQTRSGSVAVVSMRPMPVPDARAVTRYVVAW
jgi:hypothetical protein